jgi:hypothetical protein
VSMISPVVWKMRCDRRPIFALSIALGGAQIANCNETTPRTIQDAG